MPIYEYRCDNGHSFDVLQRISDDPVTSCQTCEAPVHRVFHPVAVHFKGSGFYNTDYGTRKRAREKAEAGDGAASNGGAPAKSDSPDTTKAKSADSKSESATSKPAPNYAE